MNQVVRVEDLNGHVDAADVILLVDHYSEDVADTDLPMDAFEVFEQFSYALITDRKEYLLVTNRIGDLSLIARALKLGVRLDYIVESDMTGTNEVLVESIHALWAKRVLNRLPTAGDLAKTRKRLGLADDAVDGLPEVEILAGSDFKTGALKLRVNGRDCTPLEQRSFGKKLAYLLQRPCRSITNLEIFRSVGKPVPKDKGKDLCKNLRKMFAENWFDSAGEEEEARKMALKVLAFDETTGVFHLYVNVVGMSGDEGL